MSGPRPRRICLLSDTHGVLDQRVLSLAADCDSIVHAGDLGNAGVLSRLAATGRSLIAVVGNNDVAAKWPAEDRHRLGALPSRALVDLPGGRLAVEHGHRVNPAAQRHAKLRRRYTECRAVVYGHSHRLVVDNDDRPWVINPGAAGRSRTFGGPSCLVLEAGATEWRITIHRFPAGG